MQHLSHHHFTPKKKKKIPFIIQFFLYGNKKTKLISSYTNSTVFYWTLINCSRIKRLNTRNVKLYNGVFINDTKPEESY